MSDDNLIKPVLGTDPDPLMVSTFAEPSYATLTLAYGKEKAAGASWPIECSKLVISIPTGRQATALTGDPQRINPSTGIITAGNGKKWSIAKDSTDPNRTDYTLVPDDDATFDGTWQLNVELSGIEVNGAIGPVTLGLTEKTKTSGGEFTERTGHVEVVKRDDAFSFHSLRPTKNVIERNGTVQLNWEGSSNAEYTVYFRDKDGEDRATPLPNPGGTWTSPALVEATNFTLKATLGDKDLYQTTHVWVAEPDLRVNTLGVADHVVSDLTVAKDKTLRASTLRGTDGSVIKVGNTLDQESTTSSLITGTGGVQANGNLSASGTTTLTKVFMSDAVTVTSEGSFTVEGETSLVDSPQSIELDRNSDRKFTAPTSGVAIGIVRNTSGTGSPLIKLAVAMKSFEATAPLTNGSSAYSTTVLPVKKGAVCSVKFEDSDGVSGDDRNRAWLMWVPFGKGERIELDAASAAVGEHDAVEAEPSD
ncbi:MULTISPECIES: hypothetical protein [Actinosynnema]|uniref:hypothetical protein n=1 Tax=Actinosynnema TaxID=40566 RepID=UPI0020A290A9|nr:hypothetical protein [Actinosynnema pretiosum]MCP2098792.1 hypothetical protein [Actinosynnema pretiosum]